MLIEWKESYATGVAQIDGHHKHLLDLLNKAYQLVLDDGTEEELRQLLAELIDYAGYHFAAEEELMRINNYRHIDEHLREHFSFTNKVLSFEKDAREGRKYLPLEVFDFVREWLPDHILTLDVEMAAEIRP